MNNKRCISLIATIIVFSCISFTYAGIHFGKISAVKAKIKKLDKKVSGSMVFVPAGEFIMGDIINNPAGAYPQHTIYLDAYYIDRFEVTNSQYADFLNAKGNQIEGGEYWYYGVVSIKKEGNDYVVSQEEENYPIFEVTWYGAKAYAEWAGKRLPTEAEWEKAARGTDGRTYPWGEENIDSTRANYDLDPSLVYSDRDYTIGKHQAGMSPYGCNDMIGNVYEWCSDWYSTYDLSISSNPIGPATGTRKVRRGGDGGTPVSSLLTCYGRDSMEPNVDYSVTGFRCVKNAE